MPLTEEDILQTNEATPANTKSTRLVYHSVSVPSDLDIYLTAMQFGKYQSLVTFISRVSCSLYPKPVKYLYSPEEGGIEWSRIPQHQEKIKQKPHHRKKVGFKNPNITHCRV